jgi:hypothetical protein
VRLSDEREDQSRHGPEQRDPYGRGRVTARTEGARIGGTRTARAGNARTPTVSTPADGTPAGACGPRPTWAYAPAPVPGSMCPRVGPAVRPVT